MARKESKKKRKQKHKKSSSHKKNKKNRNESFEDVSSESSSDLSTSSSSSSDSKSEGEENNALTKAKAMLKFRTFQKRLEQRERAAGKSKTNVKELFDSSVPLDIEDLKAEFDNAPVPSLDNDDILRGGQESKGKKTVKVQDFSNITTGKLPSKGLMAKPKPDKLVNQFFAKELVNPKPKTSIKIGFITSKISKSAPEPVPLAPGLEICPVTPPDGYSMRSKETVEEPSHSQDVAEKEGPVQAEVKKSAPRIIHQVSEPEPETAPTSMDQSEQLAQTDNVQPDEEAGEGEPGEETEEGGDEAAGDEPSYSGPGPTPLPPANYCSAPVKLDPVDQISARTDNQEFPPASQFAAAPQIGGRPVQYTQAPPTMPQGMPPPFSMALNGMPPGQQTAAPGPPTAPFPVGALAQQIMNHQQQATSTPPPQLPIPLAARFISPHTATSEESASNTSPFDPKRPSRFDKAPPGYENMPPGFDPSKMPPGFDPSKMPPGFDPSKMPPGFDPSKMPAGFDPSKMPPFDPSKMAPFDPTKLPPGFDPSKMPAFPMPPGMRPGPFPPGQRPPFDPSRFPVPIPGRPPFDPALMPAGLPPMFRPPHLPYPPSSSERDRHSRDRDHDRDRERDRDRDRHHDSRRDHHDKDGSRREHHRDRDRDRSYEDRRSSPYKRDDRQGSPYDPNRKSLPPPLHNGHHPPSHITAAQWNKDEKPEDLKAKSPPTPEIDPRAVREALRFLQGTTDVDDDVVRKALMSIKSKQKTEKEQQKSYSAAPTAYNFMKPADDTTEREDRPMSPEIQPHEAERIVQEVKAQERLAQQMGHMHSSTIPHPIQSEVLEELPSQEEESSATPAAPGPEIPATGLPEPDHTPALDLDKAEWQIVPTKGTTEEAQAGGYTFPPEQAKEYDYNHYYMHYYQQAYNVWSEEKEKPIEARYPVSQGYGHKRALEKGGAVKGSGRAILFNKEEIQGLVLKRKKIAQEMVKNPESSEMMDKMEAVQHKLNECGVTETEIAMMETSKMQSALKKRRQEDSECPAWARADMFYGLPTVRSAIAMAILKKQGWVVGQVLGRGCPYGSAFGAGSLQPLEFMVKTDQAGLLCAEERAAMKLKKYGDVMPSVITEPLPAPRTTTSGRHPIAALADYCHQMKWKQPEYTLLKEEGLAHKKLYFFQVAVKTDKFTTPNGARNKRQAKSDAASACLERLGLMTSVPPGYS